MFDTNQENIKTIAARLIQQQDSINGLTVSLLEGGGNNRSYLIDHGDEQYFIKKYYRDDFDKRDRLNAEFSFSSHVWQMGIDSIPKPIACDVENGIGIYEYIVGRKLNREEINKNYLDQALNFVLMVNQKRITESTKKLANASEACFTLDAHIQLVENRINKLENIVPSDRVDKQALKFIQSDLVPNWRAIRNCILVQPDRMIFQNLNYPDRVLSPSDFGFHNAIVTKNNEIKFVDFEYAGWDDPAKLVCDFFTQPAIPVSLDYFNYFAENISQLTTNPELMLKRINLLLPLIKIKWCCIVLNCFVPEFKSRTEFNTQMTDEKKLQQLNKAIHILNS